MTTIERPTRVRWIIFTLACATSWLLYLHRYSWGIVKPQFRKENPDITDVELGWLDSAFLASYGFGQVPGGILGDLFGPRLLLTLSVVLWSVAAAAVAWTAGGLAVASCRGMFGLAQAGAYPVISKMSRNWFPLAVRTSVQGVIAAMGRIGGACCPIILATFLIGICGLSWQTALAVMMIPGVVLAAVLWIIVRNSPREHPWTNEAERSLVDGSLPTAAAPTEKPKLELSAASGLSLVMLLVYAFASTFQDQLYVYWIADFLVTDRGLDSATMGLFAPLPLIGGAIGGIFGGILNDVLIRKTGNRRWSRTGVAFTGKALAGALVVWSLQFEDGRMAMVILLAARFFGDWSLPTQWGAITDMGGRAAATLFGLVNTLGALGGFAAGPVLGALKHEFGWEGIFFCVAGMCLLSALTWLFIDCTKRVVSD